MTDIHTRTSGIPRLVTPGRVPHAAPQSQELTGGPMLTTDTVALSLPCPYCRGRIAAETFEVWSAMPRLVSADCPRCERRVTLGIRTWRRWLANDPRATEQPTTG